MTEKPDISNEVQHISPRKAGSPQKNKSPPKGDGRDFSRCFSKDFTVKISGERRNVETKKDERPRNRQVIPRRKSSSERSKTSSEKSKTRALSPEEKLPLLPNVTEEEAKNLNSTEQNVIELRRTMESSLFKLSAYMSQLKNENIGVESVQEYAKELRKQLAETENLLVNRQNKVENLRDVIRKSREEVTLCRQNLIAKEDECKVLGQVVHGDKYNTPSVGADNISRKLAQIAHTAQKVKTHSEELEEDAKEEVPVKSDKKDVDKRPVGLIGAEFSSSLAHLKANQGANLDPQIELCRFELAGRCSDDSCSYQHHFK